MALFIGFGHRRQMGKDTAARALKKMLDDTGTYSQVECRAFADPLYEICHKLYAWDGFKTKSYYEDHPEDKNLVLPHIGKTARTILIEMGTPAVRKVIYENTWIDYLLNGYPPELDSVVLITDVRFPNEFQAIKDRGGVCIKIERPGVATFEDVADSALKDTEFDLTIINDSTPEEMATEILGQLYYYL